MPSERDKQLIMILDALQKDFPNWRIFAYELKEAKIADRVFDK